MWNWFGYHLIGYVHRIAHKHYCLVHIVKNLNEADQKQWTEKASNWISLGNATSFILSSENEANVSHRPPITHSHYTGINTPNNSNTAVTWTPHEYHSEISVNIQDLTTNIRKISTCTVRLQAPKMIEVKSRSKGNNTIRMVQKQYNCENRWWNKQNSNGKARNQMS